MTIPIGTRVVVRGKGGQVVRELLTIDCVARGQGPPCFEVVYDDGSWSVEAEYAIKAPGGGSASNWTFERGCVVVALIFLRAIVLPISIYWIVHKPDSDTSPSDTSPPISV